MAKKKQNLRFHEPKQYKTKLRHELIKFFEIKTRTIDEFCLEMNRWRIDHGMEPIEGTPFKHKDGRMYKWCKTKALRLVEQQV